MKKVNIHDAKTHFSKLLARVERGERIIIARGGVAIAELRPIDERTVKRTLGEDKGRVWIAPDFDAPLPPELLAELER